MIRPIDGRVIQSAAQLAKRDDPFVGYLRQWLQAELERLPKNLVNPMLAQGRCQVLQELVEFVNTAPSMDSPRPNPARQFATHTE